MSLKRSKSPSLFVCGIAFGVLLSIFCGFKTESSSENPFYPKSTFILERAGYILSYDGRTKGANWVYERLTSESIASNVASRKGHLFREDEDLPQFLRASAEDFWGSGYDRGHLCPAGDCKSSPESMRDSFLLSNVSPQVPDLNRRIWRELETEVRALAMKGEVMHVYTIPLFLPSEINGQRYVHYPVIGKNDVSVPTHFAKIVFMKGDQPIAYILPNANIPKGIKLEAFRTTVEKVERAAGLLFPMK
jgi:endonuclease G